MFKSKSANKQTLYNIISMIARTGFSALTMPIFTRLLGTVQYGKYNIYLSWYGILCCVISLGCGQGLATGKYKFRDNYNKFRSSLLFGGTIMCVLTTVVGIIAFPILSRYITLSFPIYILLFIESAAAFVTKYSNEVWIYEKRADINMIITLITVVSTTVFSLLLLFIWRDNDTLFVGRILGTALPTIIIAIFIWITLFKKEPCGYIKKYWIYSFGFGLPIIWHTLSHQVLSSSDRIMLQYYSVDESQIGIYSFYYNFTAMLALILNAIDTSWAPFLYDGLDKKNYKELNVNVKNYVILFSSLVCGFVLLSPEVTKVFANSEYWSGKNLVPIIVMAMYCQMLYQFPVNYEFFKAKPRNIAYGTTVAAIENIILNCFLIPRYHVYGAAIATMISYGTLAILHTLIVKTWKEEKYPLTLRAELYGLIAVMLSCLMFYCIYDLWTLRWLIAASIGIYLVVSTYKRRSIF